jgi:hypothetical protein
MSTKEETYKILSHYLFNNESGMLIEALNYPEMYGLLIVPTDLPINLKNLFFEVTRDVIENLFCLNPTEPLKS